MRLFVALDLPEEVRHEFRELIARLKKECPAARWVRPEGIHVTLKFIGEREDIDMGSIREALAPVRSEQAVEMEFRGLGFFPDARRPRVVWCGVEASANLAALAGEVAGALEALGIERETREYTPHLTLARLEPGKISAGEMRKLVLAAESLEGESFGTARAGEFYLFESILKPAGAEYRKLQAFPFVRGIA